MNEYPMSRKNNLVVQKVDSEFLIYDLNVNKAFCLNETSGLVWQLSDGKNSVSDIGNLMSRKLNTLVSEDLIWLSLMELEKCHLLEKSDHNSNHFAGMSRREIIKKVGLGTMVALPIISSMVAPTAVFAASCGSVAPGGPSPGCTSGPGSGFQTECISCCCAGVTQTCAVAGAIAPGNACIKDCRCASGNCQPNGMCA